MEMKGLWTAMVTPFLEGSVDEKALLNQVRFQLEKGVDGLVVLGTTGEASSLDLAEKERVIQLVVGEVAGERPVVVGTGTNATQSTIEMTQLASRLGAHGALVVAPYYNRPCQEGLYQHFHAVHRAVDLPLCLYNHPGRTGCDLEPATVRRLAELERVVAIKDATGDVGRVVQQSGLHVLAGDDSLTLPMMALGAQGVISVTSNLLPGAMGELVRAMESGGGEQALQIHLSLCPLWEWLSGATNPVAIKAAMEQAGLCAAECRLPLLPLSTGAVQGCGHGEGGTH